MPKNANNVPFGGANSRCIRGRIATGIGPCGLRCGQLVTTIDRNCPPINNILKVHRTAHLHSLVSRCTLLWGLDMPRISVLLTDDEFALFQQYCDEQGHKKSTLVAKLIRDLVERERVVGQRQLFVSTDKSGRQTA